MKKLFIASALLILSTSAASFAMDQSEADARKMRGMEKHEGMMKGEKMHHGWMKKFDANNDGSISRAEADAAHDAKFKEMDTNKDGTIAKDELKAHHEAMMDKRQERREEFMSKFDANKDGKIDDAEKAAAKKEMKAKHEAMMKNGGMKAMRDDGKMMEKPSDAAPAAGK